MDNKLSVYIFVSLVLITCWNSAQQIDNSCDDKSKCQYQCHCEQTCVGDDGTCPQTSKCSRGWFGLNCQYQNLLSLPMVNVFASPSPGNLNLLTDYDDATCIKGLEDITVSMSRTYPFTWLRMVKSNLSQILNLTLYYQTTNTLVQCRQQRSYLVNNKTLDVRCFDDVMTSRLQIKGNMSGLCSLYISAGRNFAYKQTAQLSTTHEVGGNRYGGDYAVDGFAEGQLSWHLCAHSGSRDPTPTMTLLLQDPVMIQRVKLYNSGPFQERLKNFVLNAFNKTNTTVFHYIDYAKDIKAYHEVNLPWLEPIQRIDISATHAQSGVHLILTICEIEAFGECPIGKWGLRCVNDCPAECNLYCHIDDGSCDKICIEHTHNDTRKEKCFNSHYNLLNELIEKSCEKYVKILF